MDLDSLFYRVDFNVRTPVGEHVAVASGFFSAPSSDFTVQLAEVMQQALSSAAGARISGGEFVGETVVFQNFDGSMVSPITFPEGFLVFLDNGDSTWSVG
jgi:hypothetical protein